MTNDLLGYFSLQVLAFGSRTLECHAGHLVYLCRRLWVKHEVCHDFTLLLRASISNQVSKNGKMTICGTDEYMAPEMLFDESFSYPADMFSFGKQRIRSVLASCGRFHLSLCTAAIDGPRSFRFPFELGAYTFQPPPSFRLKQELKVSSRVLCSSCRWNDCSS